MAKTAKAARQKEKESGSKSRSTAVTADSKAAKPKGKAKRGDRRRRRRKREAIENRPVLEPNAAGVDIGAREVYVAVPRTETSSRYESSRLLPPICKNWPTG